MASLHVICIELNSNKLNRISIQLKRNGMQISEKNIEILFMNMMFKKILKKTHIQKNILPCFLLEIGLRKNRSNDGLQLIV
jgi:hypothetical protein